MTGAEWLTCADPGRMLPFLAGKASDRKLRLFACACCRRVWHLLREPESRQAVTVAERFADGAASAEELAQAKTLARQVTWSAIQRVHAEWGQTAVTESARAAWVSVWVACAAEETTEAQVWNDWTAGAEAAGQSLALRTAQVVAWAKTVAEEQGLWGVLARSNDPAVDDLATQGPDEEELFQCDLLRDLFGQLFQPAHVDPTWTSWQGGIIATMAQVIHDERRFGDLPILADALEDAGCDNEALLAHCRLPGPHVRGCWAVDALLGRA